MGIRPLSVLLLFLVSEASFTPLRLEAQARLHEPDVRRMDLSSLDRLIRQRKGRVLFLNLWATWCKPCIDEFPRIIELARAYSNRPIDIVALSADYPDEVESKVLPFLARYEIPFRVFVADAPRQEDLINAIDPEWSGALPATFIFDPQGRRQAFLLGEKGYDEFRTVVDKVLEQR